VKPIPTTEPVFVRLGRPGIDSEESIPTAYVAWRAKTTNRVSYRSARPESIPGLLKRFTNTGSE
jgi:hypothetical protein